MQKTKLGPLFIVAGNQNEFDDFVIRKRIRGCDYDFRYVYGPDALRGLHTIRGFYVGSYQERNDWPEIDIVIKTIKAKGGWLDKVYTCCYTINSWVDMEIVMTGPAVDDMVNELAREIAEATLTDYVDEECEALFDALYAEHEAMMYAAHSYDLDAIAYGEM